jgi:hypothetical protein
MTIRLLIAKVAVCALLPGFTLAPAKPTVLIVLVTDTANCGHCVRVDKATLPKLKARGFIIATKRGESGHIHVTTPAERPIDYEAAEGKLPAWVIYENGVAVRREEGFRSAAQVERWLREGGGK